MNYITNEIKIIMIYITVSDTLHCEFESVGHVRCLQTTGIIFVNFARSSTHFSFVF